ncbi:MAG: sulfite exporter TauE/SafE family protein [Actinobacteria bacterium]|nr:sulfite exporter TauE/SafE family protein [Actinomycetota bacterium]
MFAREESVTFLIAFTGGLFSFFTPCIFPLIPSFFSFLMGKTNPEEIKAERFKLVIHSLLFIAGFSVIFIVYGATASVLGSFFAKNRLVFSYFGGTVVIIFALHILGIIKIPFLEYETHILIPPLGKGEKGGFGKIKRKGLIGSFVVGMAFAAGWVPCVGPILSSILLYTAATATLQKGIIYLVFYSLGLGVPFLLSALLLDFIINKTHKLNRFLKYSSKIGGVFLLIVGTLILTNNLTVLVSFLYKFF